MKFYQDMFLSMNETTYWLNHMVELLEVTTQNIWHTELWWPTVHKDSKEYCSTCDVWSRMEDLREEMKFH